MDVLTICQLQLNCTYAVFYFVHINKVCDFAWNLPNIDNEVVSCQNSFDNTVFESNDNRHPGCDQNKNLLNISKNKMNSLNGGVFRPRGALVRTLYDKQLNDAKLRELDKTNWYKIDKTRISERNLSKFCQLYYDGSTREFVSNSIEKASWIWTQIWHHLAKSFLSFFWTRTDINGWLGRGSMFILSLNQLKKLLNLDEGCDEFGGAMIDVGAGDGEVTKWWSSLFDKMYATEISASMRNVLTEKGYSVIDTDSWWQQRKFKTVCLLNLLDRCSHPLTILDNAKEALSDDGIIIVALVLPFKPYVECTKDHAPVEVLPVSGDTFEDEVESFIRFAETDLNLEVMRWTRVPYLCEGDINQSYYWLDDVIIILRRKQ